MFSLAAVNISIFAVMPGFTRVSESIKFKVVLYVETPSIIVSAGSIATTFASKIISLP